MEKLASATRHAVVVNIDAFYTAVDDIKILVDHIRNVSILNRFKVPTNKALFV
jgi:hypothetical protein